MNIRVSTLKTEYEKLNRLIEDYNFSILNLYNELSFSENYWYDKHSLTFFDNVKMEKRKNLNMISELNNIKNIFGLLLNEYSQIGNNISCVMENKNMVLNHIDDYANRIREIIDLYNRLNLSFNPREASYLYNHKNILENNYRNIQNIRNNVKYYFERIENIEREVNLNLSRINIEYLKETNYSGVL